MTKLMVATSDSRSVTVEVINFDDSRPNVTCQNLPNLPVGLGGATGIFFNRTTPVICGRQTDYGEFPYVCQCFKLQSRVWTSIEKPSVCTWYAASIAVAFNNNEFESYVVTGGTSSEHPVNSMSIFNGQTWTEYYPSELPIRVGSHCTVKIDNTLLLMIGGYYGNTSKSTYFCDFTANNCYRGPDLNSHRSHLSCGILNWLNPLTDAFEQVVLAVGGVGISTYSMKSVELLYLRKYFNENKGWVFGSSLPYNTGFASSFEFENTLIISGGNGEVDGTQFFQLTSPLGNWVQMHQFLKESRDGHVMFLISDEVANCY
jgi:hypothetical protein